MMAVQTALTRLKSRLVPSRGRDDELIPPQPPTYGVADSGANDTSTAGSYTVDEAIEAVGFGMFQVKLSIFCGFAWIADAMEVMVLSILGPELMCKWRLANTQEAMITTVVFVGFLIGSPVFGYLGDVYGRRASLMVSSLWAMYYGLLSALAPRYAWLLVLRALLGFGVGGAPQAVTYYSEFLPLRLRGKCIMLLELFYAVGTMLEVLLAMAVLEPYGWRAWLAVSAFPLLIFALMMLYFPESPRYDLASGHVAKATATLRRVAAQNKTSLPAGTLRPSTQVERGSFRSLFDGEFKRVTPLLWIIWFVATFTYYGVVLMSTEIINSEAKCIAHGLPNPQDSTSCSAHCKTLTHGNYISILWTAAAELPGLLITMLLIDTIGRKASMYIEYILFAIVCFLLFICSGKTMLLVLMFTARALVSSAFQVVYVYTPEVYPTASRGLALGICSGLARLGAIVTPFVAEVLLKHSVRVAISVYACTGLLAAAAAFLLPIETRGRALEGGGGH